MRRYSFVAYDNHGNFLGYLTDRPKGEGLVTVWNENNATYVKHSSIGRIERYNLQAIHKQVKK